MGRNTIDKTGEKNYNTFGSEMIIIKYRTNKDIDVYFPEYDWTFKGVTYQHFKNGLIKCPYEKRTFGVGYLGEGEYKTKENGKLTRVYETWCNMIRRCYDEKIHKKRPTYKDCSASEEFHNFQNFGMWDKDNYYKIEGEQMCLDKDILVKGNKIYSPETCIFVPNTINLLFIKNDNKRGKSLIGTSPFKGKYVAQCRIINPETGKSKNEYLGRYETQEEAFKVYKYYKERNIKEIADYYKEQIPQILYNTLYNYEVEITD